MPKIAEIDTYTTPGHIWAALEGLREVRKSMADKARFLDSTGFRETNSFEVAHDAAETLGDVVEAVEPLMVAADEDMYMKALENTKALAVQWAWVGAGRRVGLPAKLLALNAAALITAGVEVIQQAYQDWLNTYERLPRVQEAIAKADARNLELKAEAVGHICPIVLYEEYLDEQVPSIPDWVEAILNEMSTVQGLEFPPSGLYS
jgi:hypothetical protein